MLHKEEAGLTSDRSLEGAPADVQVSRAYLIVASLWLSSSTVLCDGGWIQSFQIFLSGEWRVAFDKIYISLAGAAATNESVNQSRARAAQAKAGTPSLSYIHFPIIMEIKTDFKQYI